MCVRAFEGFLSYTYDRCVCVGGERETSDTVRVRSSRCEGVMERAYAEDRRWVRERSDGCEGAMEAERENVDAMEADTFACADARR